MFHAWFGISENDSTAANIIHLEMLFIWITRAYEYSANARI